MGLPTPQFRYTHPLNPHNWTGVTVEKSGTDVPFSAAYGSPVPTSKIPDFVVFYRRERQAGHLHAATIFRSWADSSRTPFFFWQGQENGRTSQTHVISDGPQVEVRAQKTDMRLVCLGTKAEWTAMDTTSVPPVVGSGSFTRRCCSSGVPSLEVDGSGNQRAGHAMPASAAPALTAHLQS
jgi:hypothetical protein